VRLRPANGRDLKSVHAVVAARERIERGSAEHRLADLSEQWRLPGFDLAADARVAEGAAGRLVGYGEVCHEGSLVVVAPDAEGGGVGTILLGFVEARAPELGHTVHRQLIASSNESGERLLRRAGYHLARSNHRMRIALAGSGGRRAGAGLAATIRLRQLDPDGDAVTLHALDCDAFSGQPGYRSERFDAFVAEHLRGHDLDAGLSSVVEAAGRMIGFTLVRRRMPEGVGYVDLLAVHPDLQGRGVGSALLGAVIDACRSAGLGAVELTVSSHNSRAIRLYRRHGLEPVHRSDIYEKLI
jgi:ribosomal-protein-alanine N-acetyltransferase